MKHILLTILNGLIIGCTLRISHSSQSIDVIARKSFDKFVSISKECNVSVDYNFTRIEVDYDHPRNQFYAISYSGSNLIVINYARFSRLPDYKQEQVIFHEMGHATLDLRHNDNELDIMNTVGFIDDITYKQYFNFFIHRLFKDCNKAVFIKYEYF